MDKIIVIPDEHGRGLYKQLTNYDKRIVFLGDYLDPYHYEGISYKQALTNLEEIINLARNHKNITLLIGNHDLSYILFDYGCTRFNRVIYNDAHNLFKTNIDLFKPYLFENGTLFTHAGITKKWAGNIDSVTELCKSIDLEWNEVFSNKSVFQFDIFSIGEARGGGAISGGPFWADASELKDGTFPIPQVTGHNQLYDTGSTLKINDCICCDSRAVFEYDFKTKEICVKQISQENI